MVAYVSTFLPKFKEAVCIKTNAFGCGGFQNFFQNLRVCPESRGFLTTVLLCGKKDSQTPETSLWDG